jgi:adenylosuccinate synthase
MKIDVLLGLQWGDEGKGKLVDVFTPDYDVIARFQGGPNAGHTLEFNNIKHITHNIPSGVFREGTINIIGNGVVLDPIIFKGEIDEVSALGVDLTSSLLISKRAHLILPTHRILDAASEAAKGKTKIGSTLKGITPTYMDKTGRNGMRAGDIESPDFLDKYKFLCQKHLNILKQYDFEFDLAEYEKGWMEGIEVMRSYKLVSGEYLINQYLDEGKSVLAEGAQGTLLDIDFGSYPYVTSSNTICAGACTGLGVAPNKIGKVIGIFKAYCTRVGSGPFPTELENETGQALRDKGAEYGATTGRPRRCGWLDLPVLKYSIMLNGVTELMMTKSDVLSTFESLLICTAYKINGKETQQLPYDIDQPIEPVYREMPSWNVDISNMTSKDEMPQELLSYIDFIEKEVNVPISVVSVGPDRKEFIKMK